MVRGFKYLVVLLGVFSMFACNKEAKLTKAKCKFSPRCTKVMLLAGDKMKKWDIDKYSINGTVLNDVEDYHHGGNSNVFFTDHRLEIIRDDKIEETGHWYFNEDSTEIEVSLGAKFFIYRLIEITQSELQFMCVNSSDTIETVMRPQQF